MGAHFQPAPPAAVSRMLATFNRDQLAGFIEIAISLLDLADPDPDIEENGDEEDAGIPEQHGFQHQFRAEIIALGEDAEDDDPPEDGDEDCEHDGREEEHTLAQMYGIDQTAPCGSGGLAGINTMFAGNDA